MSSKGELSLPEGVTAEKTACPASHAEWIRPDGADERMAILYFHGGGSVRDSVNSYKAVVGSFVKEIGYKALLFDYQLASELPAPAAVFDSAAIYIWMLDQGYRPEDIIFAGDSAGGGIELETLIKLRDDGVPLPAACIAFSPSLNITFFRGDLTGLPPIMIHVGNDEVLRDDATLFGVYADSYHVDVRVKVWKGMIHSFPLSPGFEEAKEAMLQVKAFISQHMHKEERISAAFLYMMFLRI